MTKLEERAAAELRRFPEKVTSQSTESGLRLVPTNLYADQSPPEHVIDRLVPRGVVTLLGAHGGAGKSVLALTLAAMVATGRTWAELGIDKGKALFVSLEDPGALVNFRLRRIADAYGLDRDVVTENVVILDGSDADAALVGEVRDNGVSRLGFNVAAETLRLAAKGCSLIVVDNASDAYDANENERRLVRGFVRLLTQIARENKAGMILLAHVDKLAARNGAQGNTYSGSTAWHNSARSRLALVNDADGVELRQEKANLGRPLDEAIRLYWTDQGILMPLTGDTADARRPDDADAVLGALRAAWAAGINVPVGRVGAVTSYSALATFSEFPDRLRTKDGRAKYWRALDKLIADGRVRSAGYRGADRHVRQRIESVDPREMREMSAAANPPYTPCDCPPQGGAGNTGVAGNDCPHIARNPGPESDEAEL